MLRIINLHELLVIHRELIFHSRGPTHVLGEQDPKFFKSDRADLPKNQDTFWTVYNICHGFGQKSGEYLIVRKRVVKEKKAGFGLGMP